MGKNYKLDWNIILRLVLISASIATTYYLIDQSKKLQKEWAFENEKRALIESQKGKLIDFVDQIFKSWDKGEIPVKTKLVNIENCSVALNRVEFSNSNYPLQTPLAWSKPPFDDFNGIIVTFLDRNSFYYEITQEVFEKELLKIQTFSTEQKSNYKFPFKPTPLPPISKSQFKKLKESRSKTQ